MYGSFGSSFQLSGTIFRFLPLRDPGVSSFPERVCGLTNRYNRPSGGMLEPQWTAVNIPICSHGRMYDGAK